MGDSTALNPISQWVDFPTLTSTIAGGLIVLIATQIAQKMGRLYFIVEKIELQYFEGQTEVPYNSQNQNLKCVSRIKLVVYNSASEMKSILSPEIFLKIGGIEYPTIQGSSFIVPRDVAPKQTKEGLIISELTPAIDLEKCEIILKYKTSRNKNKIEVLFP
jgi:hypothetical protein